MHISDGVLGLPVHACGSTLAAALTVYSLKKVKNEDIPAISVMTAAFFVVSLIHIKMGPVSGHLMLNGLVGIILGLSAFPAILVALFFQAIMFQHGGITTLGVNSLSMGIPALLAYSIFKLRAFSKSKEGFIISALSFISAFSSVMFSAFFISLFLVSAGNEFFETAKIVLAIHAPIAVIEGLITVFIISFLYKVKPDMIMN